MEDFKERIEKRKKELIEFYKNVQLELINSKCELIIEEPFSIDILDPESETNAFNYNRGFYTTAYIFYKEKMIGIISPRFRDYGTIGFEQGSEKFHFNTHSSFRELSSLMSFLIEDSGNGLTEEKESKINILKGTKDFDSIQECIDYSKQIQRILLEEFSDFLDPRCEYEKYDPSAYVVCKDCFGQEICDGDYIDFQPHGVKMIDGVKLVYKKEDGQLYFKPKGEEERVSGYFSDGLIKCDENGEHIIS